MEIGMIQDFIRNPMEYIFIGVFVVIVLGHAILTSD
jgi:hypothetical protein